MLNYNTAISAAVSAVALAIVGAGAIDGIVTNCAISYVSSLSPLIIGGVIGVGLLKSLLITSLLVKDLVSGSEEFPRELVKTIMYLGSTCGIGVGLVIFGIASPAAIGAIAITMGAIIVSPLFTLVDKPCRLESVRVEEYQNGYHDKEDRPIG